ncbi:hypothetical protein [Lysobacter arvi]|uniref:Uncharacterized protein n=1 Tax=Lysobacter arvi TaxID=3038776 RepID=A0ABU1CGL2_9GAMM|nr:hypothetical protein [Lysobacter arvi]MDR0184096.1 hypothetical protein [Lysobacter arvi]
MRYIPHVLAFTILGLLAGCSNTDDAATSAPTDEAAPAADGSDEEAAAEEEVERYAYSVDKDGIDICFRKIREKLGPDARVNEIQSYFSAGTQVDPDADEPKGTLTTCAVDYQNPDDARKLLSVRMDVHSGEFGKPRPVELHVTGNKQSFKLDDYVIALGKIDTAPLQAFMDSQKSALDKVYSVYAWDDIRLQAPGTFSDKHRLRVRLTGRFKSNDLENTGDATLAIDGKTVVDNDLTK